MLFLQPPVGSMILTTFRDPSIYLLNLFSNQAWFILLIWYVFSFKIWLVLGHHVSTLTLACARVNCETCCGDGSRELITFKF